MKTTRRATVPALEDMLGTALPVLDNGFVRVVDYMGDDAAIVQAARVSYGNGTKTPSDDRGLIRYLMRHRHSTPFEMCEIKFHVKLPIFVARQWIRHRTANVNEVSARYSVLDREFYVPKAEHIAKQSMDNKQGSGEPLGRWIAAATIQSMHSEADGAFVRYDQWLQAGVARETARIGLPLSTYTEWYWKCDLHNLFHFLSLRADPHAQWEIRVYANIILGIVKQWVPLAYQAFEDYRMNAVTLSAQELSVIRAWLAGDAVSRHGSGLSSREWDELIDKFPHRRMGD